MAYEIPDFKFTLPANADLSGSQYLFAVCTGGNAAVAGAGVVAIGVINNKPTAGQATEIIASGVAKVKAGAAVAAGARVMSNASGQAITATTTNFVTGIALSAAAAANEVISVLVTPMGHFALV